MALASISTSNAGNPPETVVGVADLKLVSTPGSILSTYALGSCIAVTLFDPYRKIGGLLHAMLPDSKLHRSGVTNRSMFVDTGLTDLVAQLTRTGGAPEVLECKVFGGARVMGADQFFRIGDRNVEAFRALSQKMGLRVKVWETGGQVNRTIKLYLETGHVLVKTPGKPLYWI
ncbi:MAG: chemotaxis protein CheD [Verrucomicrobium sp.]|nr:chemotaxis protein CheD [Verrucomicrobium sp.]